jgi:hypothetical protein
MRGPGIVLLPVAPALMWLCCARFHFALRLWRGRHLVKNIADGICGHWIRADVIWGYSWNRSAFLSARLIAMRN